MSATKFLRGECQHCGGHLEFPADATGTTADCPHCRQPTELLLSIGEPTPAQTPVKAILFTIIACVILLGGIIGALLALQRARRMAADRQTFQTVVTNTVAVNPFAAQRFFASPVTLEKTPGGSIVRAVGTLKNLSPQRRFAVRVEIEVKGDAGKLLEPATDYATAIEPGATWTFKAMVLAKGAATGQVSLIKEEN